MLAAFHAIIIHNVAGSIQPFRKETPQMQVDVLRPATTAPNDPDRKYITVHDEQDEEYKLGKLIELTDERNYSGKYSLDSVKGISTGKAFIDTKANMEGVSLDSYKVVNPGEFSYVPDTSRRGDKIPLCWMHKWNARQLER